MTRAPTPFDVVVLGGGPAGAAAATILARAGVRNLLVDRGDNGGFKAGEGVPPAAKPQLRELGVWDRLARDGHQRSHGNESAWGDSTLRSTHFLRDPNGHGWHLDRARFDALLRRAAKAAGSDVRVATDARSIARTGHGWNVTLRDGRTDTIVHARWLLDCTGRRGWVARTARAARVANDRLVATVSSFALAREGSDADADRDSMTLVESARDGWWYTSQLPSAGRIVVYLTDARDPSAARARTRQGFLRMVAGTQHVRERLERAAYTIERSPRIVSAGTSRLVRPAGDGWLAAGDAAVSFDPLSSQGLLTAMDSGMRAAEAIRAHLAGDVVAIDRYCVRMDAVYSAYVTNKREYSDYERRWAGRPFWSSRHSRPEHQGLSREAGAAHG